MCSCRYACFLWREEDKWWGGCCGRFSSSFRVESVTRTRIASWQYCGNHFLYGFKCRFAHGKEELIIKSQGLNYKKKPCKTFNEKGYCPYGSRCSFRHDERKFSELCFSYYYLQLFLLKNSNFYPSINYLNQKGSKLINGRLPVFETFTQNLNNCSNHSESSKDLYEIGRTDSISTTSITSNEEERKRSLNYELCFDNTLKNINSINDEQFKEKKNLKKMNEI